MEHCSITGCEVQPIGNFYGTLLGPIHKTVNFQGDHLLISLFFHVQDENGFLHIFISGLKARLNNFSYSTDLTSLYCIFRKRSCSMKRSLFSQ